MRRKPRIEMRLADWARLQGIPLRTAQRMYHRGDLPVPAKVTATGRIMVFVAVDPPSDGEPDH